MDANGLWNYGEVRVLSFEKILITLLLLFVGLSTGHAQKLGTNYKAEVDEFRLTRTKTLTAPDGWLSLVGLEWLSGGSNSVGSAADNTVHLPVGTPPHLAIISQQGNGRDARLSISAPAQGFPLGLKIDGKEAVAGALPRNAKLTSGSFTILILSRGERLGLRVKDENAATRTNFHGLNWYPVRQSYRIKARWIPYSVPHAVRIPTIIGTTLEEKVPGAAEFEIEGKQLRLEPIVEGDKLFFILRDRTSQTSTYQAARFLYTSLPSAGLSKPGEVVLDFNELVNPPCAYTAYATCPLPPPQNKLDVAIAAGEKRYHN